MWPNGVLADPLPTRSDEEKLRTRLKAKEKFLLIQPGIILLKSDLIEILTRLTADLER